MTLIYTMKFEQIKLFYHGVFSDVLEIIDCKSARGGSHIAAATGIPVDVITSWGGGPLVRDKMLRARKNLLPKKKLVIYMMTARDLWHYGQKWGKMEGTGEGR